MIGVRYIARLAVIPGHTAGLTYFLPLEFTQARRARAVDKDVRRTLSGRTETRHHRSDTLWLLRFRPVQEAQRAQLEEFLESVQVGDSFIAWPYVDAPSLTLERIDDAHAWEAFSRTGERRKDWMQATAITAREVS